MGDTLFSDEGLFSGDSLVSQDGRFSLVYQGDGNLVLNGPNGAMWASNTSSAPGQATIQAGDGNFVIYDASGTPQWAAGTNSPGDRLVVQNDGNVVIYDSSNSPLWATNTLYTPPGQWRFDSTSNICYFDPNGTGSDQCGADWAPGDQPELDGDVDGMTSDDQGLAFVSVQNDDEASTDAVTGLPSCNSYTVRGNVGYISVQTDPFSGTLSWGANMYSAPDNYGWWTAFVFSNGTLINTKNQVYPPHDSQSSLAPRGSTIQIIVQHWYFHWGLSFLWDGEYGGWTFGFSFLPQFAYGSLTCIKTR